MYSSQTTLVNPREIPCYILYQGVQSNTLKLGKVFPYSEPFCRHTHKVYSYSLITVLWETMEQLLVVHFD